MPKGSEFGGGKEQNMILCNVALDRTFRWCVLLMHIIQYKNSIEIILFWSLLTFKVVGGMPMMGLYMHFSSLR